MLNTFTKTKLFTFAPPEILNVFQFDGFDARIAFEISLIIEYLENQSLNRMRWAFGFCRFAVYPEEIRDFLFAFVHYDDRCFAVGVDKCGRNKYASAWRTDDSFCAGADEFGKMSDVVIGICVGNFARLRVAVNGCEAEIADVVWSAFFVEQDVPVRPRDRSVVEIVDHIMPVEFAQTPVANFFRFE